MSSFWNQKKEINTSQTRLKSWFDYTALLPENILVAVGWVWHPDAELESVELRAGETTVELKQFEVFRGTRKDVCKHFGEEESQAQWGTILIAELAEPFEIKEEIPLQLQVISGSSTEECSLPVHESSSLTPFRDNIQILKVSEQVQIIKSLVGMFGEKAINLSKESFKPLEQFKQFVRLETEKAVHIPGKGLFLYGWLMDSSNSLKTLRIKTDDQLSKNLLENIARTERPDVLTAFSEHAKSNYKPGYYMFVEIDLPESTTHAEFIYFNKEAEWAKSTFTITQATDLVEASKQILVNFRVNEPDYIQNLTNHIGPALSGLWDQQEKNLISATVKQFGNPVKNPDSSVIVPIYGRYDFVLYQLAQFINDEDFQKSELIYVLDDPRIHNEFMNYCASVAPIFPVPFKVVYGGKNLGYAGANNLGAAHSSGKYLLLLNSDVIPSSTGWLTRMINAYKKNKNTGVLGTKLIFEDDTIQHNGLSYHQSPQFGDLWLVDHPGKGLPQWLIDQQDHSEVPAVTGACMLISHQIYNKLNGLDESYILGDFEDSDLCMKALQAGYKNYLLGSETLYHLERQSQNLFDDTDWKFKLTIFNGWQHTMRWGKTIEQISSQ